MRVTQHIAVYGHQCNAISTICLHEILYCIKMQLELSIRKFENHFLITEMNIWYAVKKFISKGWRPGFYDMTKLLNNMFNLLFILSFFHSNLQFALTSKPFRNWKQHLLTKPSGIAARMARFVMTKAEHSFLNKQAKVEMHWKFKFKTDAMLSNQTKVIAAVSGSCYALPYQLLSSKYFVFLLGQFVCK